MPIEDTPHLTTLPKARARVTQDPQGQPKIEVTYHYYLNGFVVQHTVWVESSLASSRDQVMLWCRDQVTDKLVAVYINSVLYDEVWRQYQEATLGQGG